MHSNWRDCAAWRDQHLPMNTVSNEACKLYDRCLTQLVSYREDEWMPSLNGMVAADPEFVIGHCLKASVELLGNNAALQSADFRARTANLTALAKRLEATLSRREMSYVRAVELLQAGELTRACDSWEAICVEHPTDMLAIKLAHSAHFYLGNRKRMAADCLARVLPAWKSSLPLYSYLYGMYAFGLSQNNRCDRAEWSARHALDMNRHDAWAAHAMCHVNEYRGTSDAGLRFVNETEQDWRECNFISSHLHWHACLFHLDKGETESVVRVFDEHFIKSDSPLDLANSAQLLTRLKMAGFGRGPVEEDFLAERWRKMRTLFDARIDQHGYLFSDCHVAMLVGACGSEEDKARYFDSLSAQLESMSPDAFLTKLNRDVGVKLLNAIVHFQAGEFDQVVEHLYPIRYNVVRIGGSNAQLDVFNQMLVYSACRSAKPEHKPLAAALYNERLMRKEDTTLTERLALTHNLDD